MTNIVYKYKVGDKVKFKDKFVRPTYGLANESPNSLGSPKATEPSPSIPNESATPTNPDIPEDR